MKLAVTDRIARRMRSWRAGGDPQTTPGNERPLRVAFIDHCALLSGGELALARLLPSLDVEAHVVLADEGPLVQLLQQLHVETTVLPMRNTTRTLPRDLTVPSLATMRAAIDTAHYIWLLGRWLRAHDFDVVHTNSLKAAVYGGLAARLARVPVVWHIRDRIAPDYLPAPAIALVGILGRFVPTVVIANSQATMTTVSPTPRSRRFVLHDAVELSASEVRRPRNRAEVIVGTVGRLAPWKGQDVFLKAFAEAFPTDGRAVVVGSAMFGEHDYARSLRDLAEALGIADRVDFTGFRGDVSAELERLDIFVHASIIPEPFGQVVIEAMAAGLPVIAAAAGGPREVITAGVDGLFHTPGDVHDLSAAMKCLAADFPLRERLGDAAQIRAKRFDAKVIAADLMSIYRDGFNV